MYSTTKEQCLKMWQKERTLSFLRMWSHVALNEAIATTCQVNLLRS